MRLAISSAMIQLATASGVLDFWYCTGTMVDEASDMAIRCAFSKLACEANTSIESPDAGAGIVAGAFSC